jgi:putative addiction module component (TIGR02574 family)
MSLSDIQNLSLLEKVQLMEQLWDSLDKDNDITSPKWHKDILDTRQKLYQEGNLKTISLDELKDIYR